ncbi:UBC-like protein [Tothia fuscella]|uniref:UBC-like protein n=1 Tax=Tothia fuscella TaxID=1048955 RepID=A0A9P4NYL0_9PEZI|nr:UBC-like protein [Tothia fuscella]
MSVSSKTRSTTKRLIQELQDCNQDPNEALLSLGPVNDNELTHWNAVLKGVEGTAYEGGQWLLNIQIPPTYPLTPPTITFTTPICHPNINIKTGEICLDLLKTSWTPAYTISSTLTSIHQLLTTAEPDSPLNIDVAQLFRSGDWRGADSLIRYYTRSFRWEERGR